MIRISMLRNIPVIYAQRQIGLVQSASFDQARKRVCAFVISCGLRGKRMILPNQVRLLTDDYILVDGWVKYQIAYKQRPLIFVRDIDGVLVGCVTDYAIDREKLDVLAVEVMPGYLPCDRHRRLWLYTYHISADTDELSIPCGFV